MSFFGQTQVMHPNGLMHTKRSKIFLVFSATRNVQKETS